MTRSDTRLQHIRSVVERARAGDQVAMALITETGRQARAGNRKAKQSSAMLQKYIKRHPPAKMGAEPLNASTKPPFIDTPTNRHAQAALWNAQRTAPEQFASAVARTAPFLGAWPLTCAIFHGPMLTSNAPLLIVAKTPNSKIAACVRRAFRLQRLISDPKVPISSYCRSTAIELGE